MLSVDDGTKKRKKEHHPLFRKCSRHSTVSKLNLPASLIDQKSMVPFQLNLMLSPADIQVVVYHAPCPDGYLAALTAYLFNSHIEFFGTSHADLKLLLPQLKSKNVLFVDICPVLSDITREGLFHFIILDHHDTSERDLTHLHPRHKFFHRDYSGCVLAWYYFFPQLDVPYIYKAIQTRDLWIEKDLPRYVNFLSGHESVCGYCATCWQQHMGSDTIQTLEQVGEIIEKSRLVRVDKFVSQARPRYFQGYITWVVNVTDISALNDIGVKLLQDEQRNDHIVLMFFYNMDRKHYCCSLRSKTGMGPHVGNLAKQFSGGGHMHAAGFIYTGSSIEGLFTPGVALPVTPGSPVSLSE